MSQKSNAGPALQNSTNGEAPIWEIVNSNLTPEELRRRAAPLLAYPTVDSRNARFAIALGNACSATERLPTSAMLSTGLEKRGYIAVASGGFTDIWRGEYYAAQVAIKAFRIYPTQNLKEAKEILWKRVPMWRRLYHENILSFRGITVTLFQLALIYDWGQNGNISQYLASHPRASRASLVRKSRVTVVTNGRRTLGMHRMKHQRRKRW